MRSILDVATSTGTAGIHPGYGFLSENEHFASGQTNLNTEPIGARARARARTHTHTRTHAHTHTQTYTHTHTLTPTPLASD